MPALAAILKALQSIPMILGVIESVRAYFKKRAEAKHLDAVQALKKAQDKKQREDAIKDIARNG